jgi:DNA-binding NtrC family response regulator
VLIVDDQPEVLRVYARALEIDDCDTQTAPNAQAAMDLVDAAPPDAILLDLKMPFVNGVGFLYRLRTTHPQLPVAIVTGLPALDPQTEQEIQELRADVAFKPMTIAEVHSLARRLLARGGADGNS